MKAGEKWLALYNRPTILTIVVSKIRRLLSIAHTQRPEKERERRG
jgi:hypothetical protein